MKFAENVEIIIASPRGFCAGVERAITIVEEALKKYSPPIYVKHEIVHNKYVVESLKKKGVKFIEDVNEVPDNAPIIFSAHGVANSIYEASDKKQLKIIDATCPLVKKVHFSVKRHHKKKSHVILIGHQGHPEVIGTMGQLGDGEVTLVESEEQVEKLPFSPEDSLAYTTQTTLSIGETKGIIDALKKKYPQIVGPESGDLCYATTNRQEAVAEVASLVDVFFIVGSKNSSNSNRLRELASRYVPSYLVDNPNEIDLDWVKGKKKLGISSGASAPEILTQRLIDFLKANLTVSNVREISTTKENTFFPLPLEFRKSKVTSDLREYFK